MSDLDRAEYQEKTRQGKINPGLEQQCRDGQDQAGEKQVGYLLGDVAGQVARPEHHYKVRQKKKEK